MAYNVRIMEKAEQDLSEIITYFTDKLCNPKAADSLLEEFLKEKDNIADPEGNLIEIGSRNKPFRSWSDKDM